MLTWEYPPRIIGGISRVVHGLSEKLGGSGHEVHVVTVSDNGTTSDSATASCEKNGNVTVHRVRTYDLKPLDFSGWVMQMNFAFVEYCAGYIDKNGRFDIIHAHDWVVAFAARTLKHAYSMSLVSTIHATEAGRNWGIHNDLQRYIDSIEWWLTYESWRVIVNSNFMAQEVIRQFQLPWDKIRVIPNGIDIPAQGRSDPATCRSDSAFRRNYATDNEKLVFFIGRLVHEKGAHIIIEAAPKILARYHDVKFVIAGRGPRMEFLKKRAEDLGCADKVYFTGYISDETLRALYKCIDIAVIPSLYEPFGIVALEAMAAGIPVVISDTGGLRELVRHGVDGMKAYVDNPDSLADCVAELLHNQALADSMKSAALEKVNSAYLWEIQSRRLEEVYSEIVDLTACKECYNTKVDIDADV